MDHSADINDTRCCQLDVVGANMTRAYVVEAARVTCLWPRWVRMLDLCHLWAGSLIPTRRP
ncbi:MAG: hypothetical protein ACR2ME_02325 [Acidimicrobiia bacterium]